MVVNVGCCSLAGAAFVAAQTVSADAAVEIVEERLAVVEKELAVGIVVVERRHAIVSPAAAKSHYPHSSTLDPRVHIVP